MTDQVKLPVAPLPMEQQLELAQMVDAILAKLEKHGYPLPPQAQKRVYELENWIDAKVSALSKT